MLLDIDSRRFRIARTVGVSVPDPPGNFRLVILVSVRFGDEVQTKVLSLGCVVTDVRYHQIRFVMQRQGSQIFPVPIPGVFELELTAARAGVIDGVGNRAIIVNDPQQIGLPMRTREATGFEDFRVLQLSAYRKCRRCRRLGIRASGDSQQ